MYNLLTITTASVFISGIKQSVSTFSVISFNQTCYLFKDNYHLVIANWYSLNNLWDICIYIFKIIMTMLFTFLKYSLAKNNVLLRFIFSVVKTDEVSFWPLSSFQLQ